MYQMQSYARNFDNEEQQGFKKKKYPDFIAVSYQALSGELSCESCNSKKLFQQALEFNLYVTNCNLGSKQSLVITNMV